ncbi:MAG: S-layer homology domain-containing protein [Candidatus Abawacabacteria bacterium]|nr:S-layer homology domain-containing protein [Candidatus Abawacabacteria bacterium]
MWFITLAFASTQFVDLPPINSAYPAVQYLVEQNVIKGYENNQFLPDRQVTRAEALKIALLGSKRQIPTETSVLSFTDIPSEHWGKPFISFAISEKLVRGYDDNTFRPDQSISRAEVVKVLFNAFQIQVPDTKEATFSDVKEDHWFFPYARYLVEHRLWPNNLPLFEPNRALTRAEMATLTYYLMIQQVAQKAPLIPLWALLLALILWGITAYYSLNLWHKLLPKHPQSRVIGAILTGPISSIIQSIIALIPKITIYEHASGSEDSHLHPIKALLTPRKIGLELYQYLVVKSPALVKTAFIFLINFILGHILLISYYSYFYKYSFIF